MCENGIPRGSGTTPWFPPNPARARGNGPEQRKPGWLDTFPNTLLLVLRSFGRDWGATCQLVWGVHVPLEFPRSPHNSFLPLTPPSPPSVHSTSLHTH